MIIIDVSSNRNYTVSLGKQGENEVRTIAFDYSKLAEKYGEGTLACIVSRPKDVPYPAVLTVEGHTAVWSVNNADTAYSGYGRIQLSYSVGEQVKKSVIYKTYVDPSIVPEGGTPPEPIPSYIDQLVEIGNQVHEDAESARESAQEAESYAENLHFEDDGEGNITIRIGG